MGSTGMSQTRKRAWLGGSIWTLAGVGFLVTFLSRGGPDGFAADSMRHLAGAAFLAFGFAASWLSLWFTRQKAGDPPLTDERDAQVAARANQATLILVLVVIFVFTIGLWTVYESDGQVPVGWMWFLAYGSVIVASISSSVMTLIVDRSLGGHE